jgi:hypothetical protein
VVAPHGFDRRDSGQLLERGLCSDVACVEDQVDAVQDFEDRVRQSIDELGAVRVRDYADPGSQV